MHVISAINVHQNDYVAVHEAEGHHTLFAICLASILAGDGWQIPDCLGAGEIETVVPHIRQALRFVPGRHK